MDFGNSPQIEMTKENWNLVEEAAPGGVTKQGVPDLKKS